MNKMKNQRGIATLEIILALAILGIFATFAAPKMTRNLDKACLDYEMKHLYSDLNFARSLGKSSTFQPGIFTDVEENQQKIQFWIYGKNYGGSNNRYQIMRQAVSSSPYYRHNLCNDIVLDFLHSDSIKRIAFDNHSYYRDIDKDSSLTVVLKSKFGYETKIIFDSVGRWRGTYEK